MSTIKTNTIQPTQAGNNLVFANGTAVEKMRITDGGLVGIGTASPTVALDVAGAVSAYGDVKLTYPGSFLSLAYQSNSDIYRGILGWNTLQLGNNGENRIVAGNTSVGGSLVFYVNNTTPLSSWTTPSNGIRAMSILHNGNVGIGVPAPVAALDISGAARSSTSTTSASVATTLTTKDYVDSQAIGVGQTWQVVSRTINTVYTNSTGRTITASITGVYGSAGTNIQSSVSSDGVNYVIVADGYDDGARRQIQTFAIPNGHSYKCVGVTGTYSISRWVELR